MAEDDPARVVGKINIPDEPIRPIQKTTMSDEAVRTVQKIGMPDDVIDTRRRETWNAIESARAHLRAQSVADQVQKNLSHVAESLRRATQTMYTPAEVLAKIGTTGETFQQAMKADRESKLTSLCRRRKALKLADAFVQWAHVQHKAGKKLIVASDFRQTPDGPLCDVRFRIAGHLIREGHLLTTDGEQQAEEDQMLDMADRMSSGAMDGMSTTVTVSFTPSGLKHAFRLEWQHWRQKWFGWLRVFRPFKVAGAAIWGAVGLLITIIVNADKLTKAIVDLWTFFRTGAVPGGH